LFNEYVEYSKNFDKRYCVDISQVALREAEKKIGRHGVYLKGSLLNVPLDDNFFDSAISVLAIFNIHKDEQEKAVRRMLQVTKPGAPAIIVYCNPETFPSRLARWLIERERNKRRRALAKARKPKKVREQGSLYYYRHPLNWWSRFNDVADVKILPWITLDPTVQKAIVPDNRFGSALLNMLFRLEDRYPHFFGRNATYSMIVLRKRTT
jgi:ubiquinone/menaquinone biosynthesis C-methylase UbiE